MFHLHDVSRGGGMNQNSGACDKDFILHLNEYFTHLIGVKERNPRSLNTHLPLRAETHVFNIIIRLSKKADYSIVK